MLVRQWLGIALTGFSLGAVCWSGGAAYQHSKDRQLMEARAYVENAPVEPDADLYEDSAVTDITVPQAGRCGYIMRASHRDGSGALYAVATNMHPTIVEVFTGVAGAEADLVARCMAQALDTQEATYGAHY